SVSVLFRVANIAAAGDSRTGQYSRIFRGSAFLPLGGCIDDSDCSVAPFNTCCDGLCRPDCGACLSHSDCAAGQVCCVEGGAPTCQAAAGCSSPQCLDVADCSTLEATCDVANCNYLVPSCSGNACTTVISGPCAGCSICGDGRFDPLKNEDCDDGNSDNSDACTVFCRFAECGDNALQPLGEDSAVGGGDDEDCDDGNTENDDGCDALCQDEDLCAGGAPNGTQNADEECDDGNGSDTDACDSSCRKTVCGDGITQNPNGIGQGEECDDGNVFANDLCSPTCLTVTADECGNGVLETGEDCDDGMHCSQTGEPCVFDEDCSGAGNLCLGFTADGCTTPSGCTPTETPETTCNDSLDNDCDALIDCADSANCLDGESCGSHGRECSSSSCACPLGEVSETTCDDAQDNDCDGDIDCVDSDCDTETCGPGQTCQSGICDVGGPLCGSCPSECVSAATSWTVSFSMSAVACTGGDCSSFNGPTSLNFADGGSMICNLSACEWCWESVGMAECGAAGPLWVLQFNSVLDQWELRGGGTMALYTHPNATWNCNGNNTFALDSNDPECTEWPPTVSLISGGPAISCDGT
ncbi:MAG TPA: hypothetical protein VJB82_03085, partial [Candidatus Peribacterales bacterium]|nr:hypothetical protein [Candidatus Peribacterales bacterium]